MIKGPRSSANLAQMQIKTITFLLLLLALSAFGQEDSRRVDWGRDNQRASFPSEGIWGFARLYRSPGDEKRQFGDHQFRHLILKRSLNRQFFDVTLTCTVVRGGRDSKLNPTLTTVTKHGPFAAVITPTEIQVWGGKDKEPMLKIRYVLMDNGDVQLLAGTKEEPDFSGRYFPMKDEEALEMWKPAINSAPIYRAQLKEPTPARRAVPPALPRDAKEPITYWVLVMGAVDRRGRQNFKETEGLTLSEAVKAAVPNIYSDLRRVKVTRGDTIEYDVEKIIREGRKELDVKLSDGDRIYVETRPVF
jgi:hypothetical protein